MGALLDAPIASVGPPLTSAPDRRSSAAQGAGTAPYRGRFAPSPTGPLHFGSLIAAVGSYLAARTAGGEWLLRIEDIDPPREAPGAADLIIRTLDAFGFEWSGPVMRQSGRTEAYAAALTSLSDQELVFPCSCSRAELQSAAGQVAEQTEEPVYPGWCRNGVRDPRRTPAIRFRAPDEIIRFDDALQGPQIFQLRTQVGDFVVRRRDGLYAYQLAVVVDDAAQGVTHVVRGADLLESTPRQIILQRALNLPAPMYAHLPLATDANGIKLSKSTGAAAVNTGAPVQELWRALQFLRQAPPDLLLRSTLAEVWQWAIQHWRAQPLQRLRYSVVPDASL